MGSLTLLFRQPVAALQVLTNDGTWKWVRPQTDALTVNIADALQFLTNGYLKSSIHRVVAPPKDQAHTDRLGVIYMVRIEDNTDLIPIKESPVLQNLGLTEGAILGSDRKPVQAGERVRERIIKNIGANSVNDLEVIKGVKTTILQTLTTSKSTYNMSGIPFTAGMEASNKRAPHDGPGPAFEPGPADIKAAKKAERKAEKEQRCENESLSRTESLIQIMKDKLSPDSSKPKKARIERETGMAYPSRDCFVDRAANEESLTR
ncbi:2OG-Fe(II)oxygenase superfamily protein [Colletotrichum salicis]|uniref:2OG-Fe(II)oxygenase superfamily protein n=1 Tax=Colletotrichum salicis TaxID=1209931 RepID=A0A135UXW6_9PEZI|nr:2OG-Fe(II)oxygenase superfamily protein [Colletotrichum salicis]